MDMFDRLKPFILENIKCKIEKTDYGYVEILAYYCKNPDEFEIVCEFEGIANTNDHSSRRDIYRDEKFRGNDWYFFYAKNNSCDIHYSKMHYYSETLTEKKEKFKLFCDEYEEELLK